MSEGISIFRTTKRIISGVGAIELLGQEVEHLGAKKALIVTDPGMVEAGIVERAERVLSEAKVPFVVFDGVEPEPRIEVATTCAARVKEHDCDLTIGLGGGSPMDVAKMGAILATNPDELDTYFGIDQVPNPGLPIIAAPTTAGTGSEVSPNAILLDTEEKLKKGVVSPHLFPQVAILDPELTVTMPPDITASTGMDALVHAIEAYTSLNATDRTDLLALRAIELISQNLRGAYANGADMEARTNMLEGSLIAGMAFCNAGTAAVHALAYPLGGAYGTSHGVSNTLMLSYVMGFNMIACVRKFAWIASAMGEITEGLSHFEAADRAVRAVEHLARDVQVPQKLREVGVPEGAIPDLAEGAMKVTRLLRNNPRQMTLKDATEIYRQAY